MTLTYDQANYSTPPTYHSVLHLQYSVRISSFRKCPTKWECSFIDPTPHLPDPSPHFLVDRNTFLHGKFEGNSLAPFIGRRGVRTFFLFFLFVLTILGWGFHFLVSISGVSIGSRIPIPLSIPEVPVGFFWNSNVWKVRKLELQFAKFGIPIICLRRNSLCLILANFYWL